MKVKVNSFILFFCVNLVFYVNGQFDVLQSGTSADLHAINFSNLSTGYTGGNDGILLKTHNEGRTWQKLETDFTNTIRSIWFISPDTGFVAGDNSLFSRTTDGGFSWEEIHLEGDYSLKTIQFVSQTTGFVTGHGKDGGVFLRTDDSGFNWTMNTITDDCTDKGFTSRQECDDIYLMNMSFLNEDTGILGGFAYNYIQGKRPYICKTEDGGKTFIEISPRITKNEWYAGKEIVSVNYLNDHDAIAIMNTGTGTDFIIISDYRVSSFGWIGDHANFKSRGWYYGMEFLGRFTGYLTGVVDGQSQVIKTMDQGNSFMYLQPPTNNSLYASFFTDANTGYFVGQGGVILRLIDRNNIVYNSDKENGTGYLEEVPYSYAYTRKNMKQTDIHIYNLNKSERRLFQVKMTDRFGNDVPLKRYRVRIYSDEIRIIVRSDVLSTETYFYSILFDRQPVYNGKLDLSHFAQKYQ